ncbi:MAG: asparagine synthase (glutamine-hydrolyzing) [Bacteroidetes bacterium GWF2_43_63]|nr:MAG: asparagine synthase (glutamine-hydrolyzing) [Bacteroidetes bacterium GWE2_42_42]OFY55898.1 MAG: asparagine synthase (glutamine-hydrolyzing) [Bacteroidetes bacterium GWF2_43_63]HCB63509.1 asparagine synthase (glutamine-hydrolyzing) [Bacteroidales bacterium]HCY22917.1 asparagine synthase (glutamine-hydrolyzing) [Bacteroidales bacterium]
MCGITGVFSRNDNGSKFFDALPDALATLRQRGPDYSATKSGDHFLFGHARLSIIDVSEASHQPYVSEDGRYTLVFNGEIFNFREIRTELEKHGHTFRTSGDVEVVLKSFIQYGVKCFETFNGFFAIGIFDSLEQRLVLARDRFGVKPLLYYSEASAFVFASEMKAILKYPIRRTLDEQSVYEYFRLTYIPEPDSIFQEVKKLEAAHYAVITKDKTEIHSYYSIGNDAFKGNYQDACEQLRDLLSDSVRTRLISDVPIGTFLSGGIDSSIISVLAAQHDPNIHAYSIGFPDAPYYDESAYASEIAQRHSLKHTIIPVTEVDFLKALPNVLEYIDEPFGDSSAIAVNVLSSFVRQHVTVALSGDGADEVFGGYRKHRALAMIAGASRAKMMAFTAAAAIPGVFGRGSRFSDKMRQARRMGRVASMRPGERYLFLAAFHSGREVSHLLHLSRHYSMNRVRGRLDLGHPDDMNSVLRNDMKLVLTGDMLRKVDLMSMAASLEVRSPFLDYRIIDFAFSLPSKWKFDSLQTKKILSDSFNDILPESITQRPKHGFEVPVGKWMNGALLNNISNEWFDDKFIKHQGIFYPEKMQRLKNSVGRGSGLRDQSLLWSIIVFQNWWKKYM